MSEEPPEGSRRAYEQLLAARRRRHRRTVSIAAGSVVVLAAAVVLVARAAASNDPAPRTSPTRVQDAGAVIIGSADFPESVLLAHIYGDAMSARGVHVSKHLRIGERGRYLAALRDATIGAVPEYSGSMVAHLNRDTIAKTPDDVYSELQRLAADEGFSVTEFAEAQDSDTITVTAATAARYHLTSIGDLQRVASSMTFGGPVQFRTRADGIPALRSVYGVQFGHFTVTDAGGDATVSALNSGAIDAGDIFSTDPALTTNRFVALQDPKSMFAANNVVPLFRSDVLTPVMRAACDAVSARLDTKTLAALVLKVLVEGQDADRVAREWLAKQA